MENDERFEMRISKEDKALFEQAARLDGRSASGWARIRLRRMAEAEVGGDGKKGGRPKKGPPGA